MPALRGAEIPRGGANRVLPDWLEQQIARDRDGPWCDVCGQSMSAYLRSLGELTHPCCTRRSGRGETPGPAYEAAAARIIREHLEGI